MAEPALRLLRCGYLRGGVRTRNAVSGARTYRAAFRTVTRASSSSSGGSGQSLSDDTGVPGFDPEEELDVPYDQRPVNELKELRESPIYDWCDKGTRPLFIRLGLVAGGMTAFLSVPIASGSFNVTTEPVAFALSSLDGTVGAMTLILLRLYLAWAHVGNRLLSAVVEYEETGWYDGQKWVKPPRVLQRDRLLGLYEVKPVVDRLSFACRLSAVGLISGSLAYSLL